eukprot:4222177-Prymnesium_polylepis.1
MSCHCQTLHYFPPNWLVLACSQLQRLSLRLLTQCGAPRKANDTRLHPPAPHGPRAGNRLQHTDLTVPHTTTAKEH